MKHLFLIFVAVFLSITAACSHFGQRKPSSETPPNAELAKGDSLAMSSGKMTFAFKAKTPSRIDCKISYPQKGIHLQYVRCALAPEVPPVKPVTLSIDDSLVVESAGAEPDYLYRLRSKKSKKVFNLSCTNNVGPMPAYPSSLVTCFNGIELEPSPGSSIKGKLDVISNIKEAHSEKSAPENTSVTP